MKVHHFLSCLFLQARSPVVAEDTESWHQQRAECLSAYNAKALYFKGLSGIMIQDLDWDILQRNGEPLFCLHDGHRFFFVLFIYQHWRTGMGTADFGVCLPSACHDDVARDDVLPSMYRHFFDHHTDYHEDGSLDAERSVHYAFTLKEYKYGLVVPEEQRDPLLLGVAVLVLPVLLAMCLEVLFPKCWLLQAFSVRQSFVELMRAGEGDCAALCSLRVALTAALLTLHVTQGSKWRHIGRLERLHPLFFAVRPLLLVQDAFLLLSAYLCVWSTKRRERKTLLGRLGEALRSSVLKYARQLPPCLFWVWIYAAVLPHMPFNMYNHTYPWFGVKWYQSTGRCMQQKWRYAFLLGDLSALLRADEDDVWRLHNGNPCGNLWNFQFEVEAFAAVALLLALPFTTVAAVAVLAWTTSALTRNEDMWMIHHARGVSLLLLTLRLLPRHDPSASWAFAALPGTLLLAVAAVLHGTLEGGWFAEISGVVKENRALATVGYQAALAVGIALLCQACRSRKERPGPMLSALSRLSLGMNLSHLFVQFFVEAHHSLHERAFSLFAWLAQLSGIYALSALAALAVFVFVQRPWAVVMKACLDPALRLLA